MSPDIFFLAISIIAGVGWIPLIALSPFWSGVDKFVLGIVVTLLAVVYSFLNFGHLGSAGGFTSFFTFEGVTKIFSNPYLIDAAWAHIIGIDIMLGLWIKNNAKKNGINYGFVVLALILTVMVAPLGFLVYQLIRWTKTRRYFVEFA